MKSVSGLEKPHMNEENKNPDGKRFQQKKQEVEIEKLTVR